MSNSGQSTPPTWVDLGDETEEDQAIREWFAEQGRQNIERLEETAKSVLQIVMAVFSVLFAILFLAESPTYLEDPMVGHYGIISVQLFFASLFTAWLVFIPFPGWYQPNNLTQMRRIYKSFQLGKMICLYLALIFFLGGSYYFGRLIIAALS